MSKAIQERLPSPDLPALLAELKTLMPGIESTPDVALNLFLLAAMERADHYCNNDFFDDEGNDEAIPATVKAGVFKIVACLTIKRDPSLKSLSSLGVSRTFRTEQEIFDSANETFFDSYRLTAHYVDTES